MNIQLVCTDIISLISDYTNDSNYNLINKESFKKVKQMEISNYWKQKYDNHLIGLKLEHLILKGDYIWKFECRRIKHFDKWDLFAGMTISSTRFDLRCQKLTRIPKEIGNLINLREVSLGYNQLKEIPRSPNVVRLLRYRDGQ